MKQCMLLALCLAMFSIGCKKEEATYQGVPTSEWGKLLLRDKDPAIRENALEALRNIGSESIPYLSKATDDEEPDIALNAINTLVETAPNSKETIDALSRALRNENREVRLIATEILYELGPEAKAAIPALNDALKDKDWNVRYHAGKALEKIKRK